MRPFAIFQGFNYYLSAGTKMDEVGIGLSLALGPGYFLLRLSDYMLKITCCWQG